MIYLVSYDLKVPGRDYTKLYEILKTAPNWWHFIESTWLIYTPESVPVWRAKIKAVMDDNDRLLIVDITDKQHDGWLPKEAWEWITKFTQ